MAGAGEDTGDGSLVIPINLVSLEGAEPAALQWTLSYSSDVTGVTFSAAAETIKAGKTLACQDNTCLMYGLNTSAIPDGVVATVRLQIASHRSFLLVPIQITEVIAAGPGGDSIAAGGISASALLLPGFPARSGNGPVSSTQPPLMDSVWPSGSGGLGQTFTFVFSSSQGAPNFASEEILFAASPDGANSCFVVYDPNRDSITLKSDDLTGNQSKPAGSSSALENSQCVIDATSVAATPLSTTIRLGITFKNSFTGRKNIYMYADTGDGSTDPAWEQTGSYTIAALPPAEPTAESVSPDGGRSVSQTFAFVFSDSKGSENLLAAAMLFAPTLDLQNSCYVVYDPGQGTIHLEWDNAMGADAKPVNSPIPLQNSQCAIGTVSVTTTSRSTVIGLDIVFKNTGVKNIYMYGADGDGSINTGWVQKGSWSVY